MLQSELIHDLLNFVAAAKMNTEMALRHKDLTVSVRRHLERIAINLVHIQERLSEPSTATWQGESASDMAEKSEADDRRTILVIDDSQDIRSLFKAILKPYGYVVTVAQDVTEALAILAKPPFPRLILLDYSLGDSTASALLDALEAAGSDVFNQSKIVMLTAYGDAIKDPRVLAVEQKAMDAASLINLVRNYFKAE